MKRYLEIGGIIAAIVLVLLAADAYKNHVIDDAKRDAVIDAQNKIIADSKASVEQVKKELSDQIASLEKQKQTIIVTPSQAPQIIHDTIPTEIQQTAPVTKGQLPDAPVATLTKQNELDLAQFGLSCKECEAKLAAEQQVDAEKDKQIQALTTERDAAVKASKGGGFLTQLKRSAKWFAIGGAVAGAAICGTGHCR